MPGFLARATLVGLCLLSCAATPLNAGLGEPPESVDRDTPLASVQGFLRHAHAEEYAIAAQYLWLNHLRKEAQLPEGTRLARRLRFVIDRKLYLDYAALGRETGGKYVQLGSLPLENTNQPIRLVQVDLGGDRHAWVFSEDTVRVIDRLYDRYGPPLAEVLPESFFSYHLLRLELWQWLGAVLLVLFAAVLAFPLQRAGLWFGTKVSGWSKAKWSRLLVESFRGPLRLLFLTMLFAIGIRVLLLPPELQTPLDLAASSLAIVATAWMLLRFVSLGAASIHEWGARTSSDLHHPARHRDLRTQIAILQRVFEVVIYVVAAAMLLLQFQVVRHIGVSLLASAGIAGLVLGFAAQRSLSTLLAGIQLSITQPIRIGDTVVVENEIGVIEEIFLTYVVVRVWDLRRQIVPMTYFLEKPFQNWSKGSAQILGTVIFQLDYSADVDAFRAELKRILETEGKALWDGKVQQVQVTDSSAQAITLRLLVSSPDAGANFDLRCLVREKLLSLLRAHPDWIPVSRTVERNLPTADGGSGAGRPG